MTHNPYAPPTAPLAVAPAVAAPSEPNRLVQLACVLIWCQGALAVAQQAFQARLVIKRSGVPVAAEIGLGIGVLLGILITWWITKKLRAGRNWMRLLLTVLYTLGWVTRLANWDSLKRTVANLIANPIEGLIVALSWILSLCIVVLINTPNARAWFAAMKANHPGVA